MLSFRSFITFFEDKISSGKVQLDFLLCLTWNCYLYEKEETLRQQCEALQRDFEHCLLYIANDKVDFVSRYFKKMQQVKQKLYYFSNK